jgi:hypothetical protein
MRRGKWMMERRGNRFVLDSEHKRKERKRILYAIRVLYIKHAMDEIMDFATRTPIHPLYLQASFHSIK